MDLWRSISQKGTSIGHFDPRDDPKVIIHKSCGDLMLLFWKLDDEIQMSKPPEPTRHHHKSRKLYVDASIPKSYIVLLWDTLYDSSILKQSSKDLRKNIYCSNVKDDFFKWFNNLLLNIWTPMCHNFGCYCGFLF